MFSLFSEIRKFIPFYFIGKTLKNVTIYLDRFGNKKIPLWCNVNFESVFSLLFNIVYCRVTGLDFKLKFCVKSLKDLIISKPYDVFGS